MTLAIDGQLFEIGDVSITSGAYGLAEALQARLGRRGQESVYVHTSVLLKLHATGQWGEIANSDSSLNRRNIQRGKGRVLSVIGEKFPFVIITELSESGNKTTVCVPEEVV